MRHMHFQPFCLFEKMEFEKKKIKFTGNHAQIPIKL